MNTSLILAAGVFLLVLSTIMAAYFYLEEKYWRAVLARRFFGNTRDCLLYTSDAADE